MMKLTIALLFLVVAVSASPSFCHGLDCPVYTSVKNTSGYEIRAYPSASWASVTTKGGDFDSIMLSSFKTLFQYISGDNQDKTKISMTTPVLNTISTTGGPFCESNITVSFYTPFKYQDAAAPSPLSDSNIYLNTFTVGHVAVLSYGGYSNFDRVKENVAKLAGMLEKDGVQVSPELYYFAGYDNPFRAFGRHNEVWIPVPQQF